MSPQLKARQLAELEDLVAEKRRRTAYQKLETFRPYDWQKSFLFSSLENRQTLLMAANQVGKTLTGAANISYHLTGLYPDWWEGHKWHGPIDAWAAGVSAESTRDIIQAELLGPPDNLDMRGTGMIPGHCIGKSTRKPQVPDALQSILIKHHTDGKFDGWSRLTFKAFEQGDGKFMGRSIHEIWLDEQPPDSLFGQCVTRTVNTGGNVSMTFTPGGRRDQGGRPVHQRHQAGAEDRPGDVG
jgi:phage terminase large subunit-like protein